MNIHLYIENISMTKVITRPKTVSIYVLLK